MVEIPNVLKTFFEKHLFDHLAPSFPVRVGLGSLTEDQAKLVAQHFEAEGVRWPGAGVGGTLGRRPVHAWVGDNALIFEVRDQRPVTPAPEVASTAGRPWRIVIETTLGPLISKTFELGTGGTYLKIGSIPACDFVVEDPSVSRMHAVVEVRSDGKMTVTDLGSYTGTFVDGKRIVKSEFTFDSQIRVGTVFLKFSPPGEVKEATKPPVVPVELTPKTSGFVVRELGAEEYMGPGGWVNDRKLAAIYPTLEEANRIAAEAKKYAECDPVVEVANVRSVDGINCGFVLFDTRDDTYRGQKGFWKEDLKDAEVFDTFQAAIDCRNGVRDELLIVAVPVAYDVVVKSDGKRWGRFDTRQEAEEMFKTVANPEAYEIRVSAV